ncbi:MAG: hypothetical protein N4A64_12725 [Marinisporobacter sp.]|jgi:hypothetical protein|nr:hypothetical protein [Marinisporobacter sp.]
MGFKKLKNVNKYKKVNVDEIDVYLYAKVEDEEAGILLQLEWRRIFYVYMCKL